MRNSPPPSGSSWSSEPQGPIGSDRSAHQSEQVWAWPPASRDEAHRAAAWAWPPPARPRRGPAGTVGPPAGARYHRLARTQRFRWWRPPLAVVVAVLVIVLVQLILATAAVVVAVVSGIQGTGDQIFRMPLANVVMQLVVIATMAPIVIATAWLIQRRPAGTLFSVTGRLRLRWLVCCAALAVPALVLSFGVLFGLQRLTSPEARFIGEFGGGSDFALAVVLIAVLVPFQASAEEIALRGFVMQSVGSLGAGAGEPRGGSPVSRFLRTPVLGILISGTVFTALHSYFGWGLVDVAVFGIAMAWLTWFTGGLEAAIGLHVLHNITAFTISAYEGTLDRIGTGGGSWQGVLATAVEVAVYCAAVVWLARRLDVRRTVPEDQRDRDAAGAPAALPSWAAEPDPGRWRERSAHWGWDDAAADPGSGHRQQPSQHPPEYSDGSAGDSQWAAPGPRRGGSWSPPGWDGQAPG
ncbi:CPBP family intramembrane metalloprotease [Streptomonospora sp. PA3]|uniref:CPBP family intramembrane glutamic endopeptidase n=1 Tax=Streptomonospora sp. PA3 TaxID=2607326 RepID=UPI0012DD0FEA|nr:CPBP family intramembrane glutamic endopeptidase [Streptomonospora sp. PA3]MUL39835.1 CPBP family intramembrane metalloprotease [Streptomonospora sp. PA3]